MTITHGRATPIADLEFEWYDASAHCLDYGIASWETEDEYLCRYSDDLLSLLHMERETLEGQSI